MKFKVEYPPLVEQGYEFKENSAKYYKTRGL